MEMIVSLACIMMHVTLSHSQAGMVDFLGGMDAQTGPFSDPAISRLTGLGNLSPTEVALLLNSHPNQVGGAANARAPGPMDGVSFPGTMDMGMPGMHMGMMEPGEIMEAMSFMGSMGAMGAMGPMGLGVGPQNTLPAPTLVETTYVIPDVTQTSGLSRAVSQQYPSNSELSSLQLLLPQRVGQALLTKPATEQSAQQSDLIQRLDQQRRLDIILQARQALQRRSQHPMGADAASDGPGGEQPVAGERSMAELLRAPVPGGSSRSRGQVVLRAPVAIVANMGRTLARQDPLFRPRTSARSLELAAPIENSPRVVWGYQRPGGLAVPRG